MLRWTGHASVLFDLLLYINHIFARGLLIVLMIQAVGTLETSANFYQTTLHDIPEDNRLYLPVIYLTVLSVAHTN
jgi:hypothetical protein